MYCTINGINCAISIIVKTIQAFRYALFLLLTYKYNNIPGCIEKYSKQKRIYFKFGSEPLGL